MSLRGDLIAVGIAGVVIVAAGYIASKKLSKMGQQVGQVGEAAINRAADLFDPNSDGNIVKTTERAMPDIAKYAPMVSPSAVGFTWGQAAGKWVRGIFIPDENQVDYGITGGW